MHGKSHDEVVLYGVWSLWDLTFINVVGCTLLWQLACMKFMCWFVQHDSKWRHVLFSQRLQI